jgi:hypothetical protein
VVFPGNFAGCFMTGRLCFLSSLISSLQYGILEKLYATLILSTLFHILIVCHVQGV